MKFNAMAVYKRICFLVFLIFGKFTFSQNLVPNYSFETYTLCPTFASQLDRAYPWFKASFEMPEYYNSCALISDFVSVPSNSNGFQYARTGEAYVGIFVSHFNVINVREYIEVKLDSTLIEDQCYYFEMYVNQPNDVRYGSDGIGAYFSVGMVTSPGYTVFPYNPQISNPGGNIISDTLNWTRISGYFTAKGGEDYLTIGNLKMMLALIIPA
jgi:hypothetical protein